MSQTQTSVQDNAVYEALISFVPIYRQGNPKDAKLHFKMIYRGLQFQPDKSLFKKTDTEFQLTLYTLSKAQSIDLTLSQINDLIDTYFPVKPFVMGEQLSFFGAITVQLDNAF